MAKTAECPECRLKFDPRGLAQHRITAHAVDLRSATEHARANAKEPGTKAIPSRISSSDRSSSSSAPERQGHNLSSSSTRTSPAGPGSSTSPKKDRDPLGLEHTFDRLFGG